MWVPANVSSRSSRATSAGGWRQLLAVGLEQVGDRIEDHGVARPDAGPASRCADAASSPGGRRSRTAVISSITLRSRSCSSVVITSSRSSSGSVARTRPSSLQQRLRRERVHDSSPDQRVLVREDPEQRALGDTAAACAICRVLTSSPCSRSSGTVATRIAARRCSGGSGAARRIGCVTDSNVTE